MRLFGLCVIYQILGTAQIVHSQISCKNRYEVVLHERAIISCTYESSFHTVRWYEYGSDESFLRIDGEKKSGSGYVDGEFDIASDGSMIITQAGVKHEGNYTIAVLHEGGHSTNHLVQVYVIAPLENVTIDYCDLSESSDCSFLPRDEESSTILCIAKDAKPAVNITWFSISSDGQRSNTADDFTKHFNESSSLYTSKSFLRIDKDLFPLQYFTCSASGYAVKEKTSASILIRGNAPYDDVKTEQKYVMEGDTVELSCPEMHYPLEYAKITMADRREEVWMRINPSSQSDECFGQSICVFPSKRMVSLIELNRNQDASLECINGDGTSAIRHVTNVTVMVIPQNAAALIYGCQGSENCSQSIPLRGRIKCSVFSVKPPLPLTIKVHETSMVNVEFSDEKYSIHKDHDSATSSTHFSATYEIKDCVDRVTVTCLPITDEPQIQILKSNIVLKIDKDTCSHEGNGALAAVLVVVFVLLLVGIVVALLLLYRRHKGASCNIFTNKYRNKKNDEDSPLETRGEEDSQSLSDQSKEVDEESTQIEVPTVSQIPCNESTDEDESVVSQVSGKMAEEGNTQPDANMDSQSMSDQLKEVDEKSTQIEVPTDSQSLDDQSKEEVEECTQIKEPTAVNLDDLVVSFIKEPSDETYDLWRSIVESRKESLYDYLTKYIPDKMTKDENMIHTIMRFLATCQEKEWITSEECIDLIKTTVKKESPKLCLICLGIAFSLKQIDDKQYTTIIEPLGDEIHKNRGELAGVIIHYFITNDISDKFVVPLISYKGIGEKIPYPYFLQSIYEKFQGERSKEKLAPLLKDIVNKATSQLKVGIFKQQVSTESSNVQDLKKLVCKMLLFSVQEKTIDVTTCSEILKQSLNQNTITIDEFQEVVKISCKDGWLSAEIVIEILHQNLENKLDNGNDFQSQMITLLLDEKITLNQWVDALKRCSSEGLIKEDVLHLQVKYFIVNTNFGWKEEKWIKLVFDLQHENSLSDKKCLDLLQTIISKYKMTEDYLKRVLTTPAFKHARIPKKIIKKVNFKQVFDDDPERSKLLGKDAEGEVFSKIHKKNKHSDTNDGITMTSIRKL